MMGLSIGDLFMPGLFKFKENLRVFGNSVLCGTDTGAVKESCNLSEPALFVLIPIFTNECPP
jgi:hypothetical protein